jgi:hypothetical protein
MGAPARARLVADEHAVRCEPVTARATLGRPYHPSAIGAADQLADRGHSDRFTPNSGFLLGLLRSCRRGLWVGSRSAVVADTRLFAFLMVTRRRRHPRPRPTET